MKEEFKVLFQELVINFGDVLKIRLLTDLITLEMKDKIFLTDLELITMIKQIRNKGYELRIFKEKWIINDKLF